MQIHPLPAPTYLGYAISKSTISPAADIEDINKALQDINKEVELKANHEDLNNIVNDQAIINESLCTENIVGR